MGDDDLFLMHYWLKTKSFDEILNWSHYEKQFAFASMLLNLEKENYYVKNLVTLLGGKYE